MDNFNKFKYNSKITVFYFPIFGTQEVCYLLLFCWCRMLSIKDSILPIINSLQLIKQKLVYSMYC